MRPLTCLSPRPPSQTPTISSQREASVRAATWPALITVTGLMLTPVIVFDAVITCPNCGTRSREVMPEDACQHFYRCAGCGEILRPREGDCCVFCSYSDQVCPPKQTGPC